MRYQKKYPLPDSNHSHILLVWERGYKNVEMYHDERLLCTIENPSEIKKGFVLNDPQLKEIRLNFSKKPFGINVIVNGFHSPVNISHPKNTFKMAGGVFWIVVSINFLYVLIYTVINHEYLKLASPLIIGELVLDSIYILAAIYIKKEKIWAYLMGSSIYILLVIFTNYFVILRHNLFDNIILFYQLLVIGLLLSFVKSMISLMRHNTILPIKDDNVLDSM